MTEDEERKIDNLKQTLVRAKAYGVLDAVESLEKENERLKGIDAIEINGLRFNSPFEMIKWIGNAQFEIKELKAQIELYKEMLERNPCVVTPDWHCSDCLKENEELKAQIKELQKCEDCSHCNDFGLCGMDCHNKDKWEKRK